MKGYKRARGQRGSLSVKLFFGGRFDFKLQAKRITWAVVGGHCVYHNDNGTPSDVVQWDSFRFGTTSLMDLFFAQKK